MSEFNIGNLPAIKVTELTTESAEAVVSEVSEFLKQQVDEYLSVERDMSVQARRKEMRSDSRSISNKKVEIEKAIEAEKAPLKEKMAVYQTQLDALNLLKRKVSGEFDKARDAIKGPAVEWEEADKARVANHEAAIEKIVMHALPIIDGKRRSAEGLKKSLEFCQSVDLSKSACEEFLERYQNAVAASIEVLAAAIADAEKYEAEQAELERLRREKLADDEARQAKIDAEAKAAAEKQRADQAEQRVKEAEQQAAEQAKAAAEKAKQDEINRQQQEAEAAEKAKAEREADLTHRKAVNNAALSALAQHGGLTAEQAKVVLTAIYKGMVPNVSINY